MLELDFDGTAIFGGVRGKRYALVIEDGKVKSAHVEPDNTGTNGESYAPALIAFNESCNELTCHD